MSQPRDQKEVAASWLAWANNTAAHHAVIYCSRQRTIGPAVQPADILPPQSPMLQQCI